MSGHSLGFCNECRGRVPAEYRFEDGQVWFRKSCSDCGNSESLISSDAAAWQAKRVLWEGAPQRRSASCSLNCDKCKVNHGPTTLFLDVTNRCNMDCPICGFSLRGMGFAFDPPLEYFDKILQAVAAMHPRPVVNLFGGEPTVRDDMFEIIDVGRKYGIEMQVTTNGLRLADEEYCRKLCETRVGLRIGFDGRNREIYERLRNNGNAYDKKLRAFENLKKYSRRKHTIFACAALGINDQYITDLIQFCHENRGIVSDLGILPLYENWKPGEYEVATHTTTEDVERMVQKSVPGGGVDFIPAGMTHWLAVMRPFFSKKPGLGLLNFAGVHPNCESLTFLIPDGKSYRGLNHYMNGTLTEASAKLAEIVKKIEPKLSRLDPAKPWQRLRGKLICFQAVVPWLLRTINVRRVLGSNPITGSIRTALSLWKRRRTRRRTGRPAPASYLRVVVIPLEEQHSIDSERLKTCRVGSIYENVETGRIEIIPHCVWFPYRNAILRKIADKYGSPREKKKAA
jgi:7,8-dihydro-6-hydroxymethylpterin dimethyltransferase